MKTDREIAEAATPAEYWSIEIISAADPDMSYCITPIVRDDQAELDADFVERFNRDKIFEILDEIERLKKERDEARNLVLDLCDKDPCWYDRHGYCQAHLSLDYEHPCPHSVAQQKLIEWGMIKPEECVKR